MKANTGLEWIFYSLTWSTLGVLGSLIIFTIFVFLKRLIEVWRSSQLGHRFSHAVSGAIARTGRCFQKPMPPNGDMEADFESHRMEDLGGPPAFDSLSVPREPLPAYTP